MPHASNGGLRLAWQESGAGTPVLLIMGAASSSRCWYPAVDALAAKHRVVSFDNRGVGASDASKDGTIDDMAADAAAVLDAAGVGRAHVYGVSLGGVVALQLALRQPDRVRSLVLGGTGLVTDAVKGAPRPVLALAYLPLALRQRLLPRLGARGYGSAASPAAVQRDLAVLAADRTTSTGLVQQQRALRAYTVDVSAVGALRVPTLVVHGSEDRVVPPAMGAELAATLPGARMVTLDGAGHNYLVAAADRANRLVLDFLAEVDRSAAPSCA